MLDHEACGAPKAFNFLPRDLLFFFSCSRRHFPEKCILYGVKYSLKKMVEFNFLTSLLFSSQLSFGRRDDNLIVKISSLSHLVFLWLTVCGLDVELRKWCKRRITRYFVSHFKDVFIFVLR